jgi:tape measure domain-containing protein
MDSENGKVYYGVGLDNSQLRTDAAESKRILHGIGSTAKNEGDNIDSSMRKIGQAVAGVFAVAQIKNFAVNVAKVRGEFQQLEVAFETMLGSASEADALMSQLIKTAATTPFQMSDIANAAKQLLAYGVEADKVNETLIRLGDIAAGLSIPIGDLAYLYGTTMVQGRLYTQDLNQFLGRGIPLTDELAKQFGVAKDQVRGLVEQGKIGFPEVEKAINSLTGEGSRFGGLMQEQSKTITGQISNIQDSIEQMFNQLGQQSEGTINDTLALVSKLIENWETIGKTLLVVISTYGAYKAAVIAVAAAHKIAAIWSEAQAFLSLTKSITSAKDAMLLLNMATKANPIGLIIGVVGAAATAFSLFRKRTDESKDAIDAEKQAIEDFNKTVGESAGETISAYKSLQEEYLKLKTIHEKRQWITDNKVKFHELGISVNNVNDAENIFVKNTALMMDAFKKRAEAAAWQSKINEEYSKRIERQMALESEIEKITAGGKVPGTSHTTEGGYEYVDRSGAWVYTVEGAKKAREELQKSIKNDPVLKEIDDRINKYSEKMASVSSDFDKLFKQAGTSTKTKEEEDAEKKLIKEKQKIADEAAERNKQIAEYGESVIRQTRQTELYIRQEQINAMEDGYEKTKAQIDLNYDRMIEENKKRAESMLKALEDTKVLEWENKNPKATKEQTLAYRASLNMTVEDLLPQQKAQLQAYAKLAEEARVMANKEALNTMLQDVLTYEQQRAKITEDFARKRNALYDVDESGNKILRPGVTQGNVEELNRAEKKAYKSIDLQFAQREETYKAWMNEIANFTLEQLYVVLKQAEDELNKLEDTGASGQQLAVARAKVAAAQKSIAEAKAKSDISPDKRSIKEWEDLYKVLIECEREFESIGDTVGGVAGEIIKTAGSITTSALSMVNGIVQLTNTSIEAIEATAQVASKSVQSVEKASVILTIISAAIQIATKIISMFNTDDKKQEEIEKLQDRIDQLQWELDNADIVRLQESTGKAIKNIKKALQETYDELIKSKIAVGDIIGAFQLLFSNASNSSEIMKKSVDKLATAYGNMAYTADKALGADKYDKSRENLKKIAEQQLLIQEQIDKERSKKNPDKSNISKYEQQIEELGLKAVQTIDSIVEDIIGGTSSEITNQLADAFFEAFQSGEDYAKAWGDNVNDIVADILKRMLVSKYLEEPLGEIFDKYKAKWFKDGQFISLQTVIDSMGSFANNLSAVGDDFATIWENLPDSIKNMFTTTDTAVREASQKGIATTSQESVDELNGRATTIQGHTFSISENTKLLLITTNLILQSILNIENNAEKISERIGTMDANIKDVRDTVNNIVLKGIKMQ